ncbi:hypothetical protein GOV03_02745 [Candidatus Woesearchaeota archaeon]|nr:hypothetical protein [Candidatus Woesearchaeota archaeon]
MKKNKLKNRKLIFVVVIVLLLLVITTFFVVKKLTSISEEGNQSCQNKITTREINSIPTQESQSTRSGTVKSDKIYDSETKIYHQTFEDEIMAAIAASSGNSRVQYFNWYLRHPCPGDNSCYLNNITAEIVFTNAGYDVSGSEEGDAFIQIANSKESNCVDASQASFTKYVAHSPVILSGKHWKGVTCGELTSPNTCNLSLSDGFDGTKGCFSVKLFAGNKEDGKVILNADFLSLIYTWSWEVEELGEDLAEEIDNNQEEVVNGPT